MSSAWKRSSLDDFSSSSSRNSNSSTSERDEREFEDNDDNDDDDNDDVNRLVLGIQKVSMLISAVENDNGNLLTTRDKLSELRKQCTVLQDGLGKEKGKDMILRKRRIVLQKLSHEVDKLGQRLSSYSHKAKKKTTNNHDKHHDKETTTKSQHQIQIQYEEYDEAVHEEMALQDMKTGLQEVHLAYQEINQVIESQNKVVVTMEQDTNVAAENAENGLARVREADEKAGYCACSKKQQCCYGIFFFLILIVTVVLISALK